LSSRSSIASETEPGTSYRWAPSKGGLFSPEVLRARPIGELIEELEKEHLLQLHAESGGDLKEVARSLKISLRALYDRLKRLGLKPGELGSSVP
jgi:DNA-binding NtrC family response regulator